MTVAVLAAMLVGGVAQAGGGQPPVTDGYYTVAWEMPHAPTGTGADAPWPQTLYAWSSTGLKPDLGYVDGLLVDCGWFQVDVYKIDSERDRTKLAGLLDKGTLTWPEDSSIYHSSKFVEVTECTPTTTTTTMVSDTTTTTVGTTTTEPNTTTTTDPTSTTSTTGPSTTTSSHTPTTPDPSTPAPNPTSEELPYTGIDAWTLALVGVVLVAGGYRLLKENQ